MVFYLVRHGETDWNRQNRLQGREDIELNETGVRQSGECAQALAELPLDCILTSPLKRAKFTADIIAEKLQVFPAIIEQGLTEKDFGKLSGLTLEERNALLARNEDPCAESKEAVIRRMMDVINAYIHANQYENILIVSHGASINALLSHLSEGRIGTGKTILKNTCISKLNCAHGAIEIEYYNLTPDEIKKIQGVSIPPDALRR